MWTCYDHNSETGVDVAYILLADDHPGEAEIRTVMVEPLQKTGLATSIGDTIKSLILEFDGEDRLIATEIWVPPRVSRRVFSNWRHARRAQNPYGRNESWRARCSRRVSPDLAG